MPGIQPQYNPNDRKLNEAQVNEKKARVARINRSWNYRFGKHSKPLKNGEAGETVIINLVGQAIDDIVDFTSVPEIRPLVDADAGSESNDTNDDRLADLLDENDFESLFRDIVESGSVGGHVFLRLFEPEEEGETTEIALLDPRTVTVFWDETRFGRRKQQVVFYRLSWTIDKDEMRQDFVPSHLWNQDTVSVDEDVAFVPPADGWVIAEYKRARNAQWVLVGVDAWEFPFPPIVGWKNKPAAHSFYGREDITNDALNDAINFTASNIGKILKHHASPKTVIAGADVKQMDSSPDKTLFSFPGDNVSVKNIEMQSDLASSLVYMNTLRGAFHSGNRVVDLQSVRDRIGQLTNFGVRVLYSSMIDMIGGKRRNYEKGILRAITWALAVMRIEDVELEASWGDPLPADRMEQLRAAQIEASLGTTSQKTIAADLGRDFDSEQELIEKEQINRADLTARSLDVTAIRGGVPV